MYHSKIVCRRELDITLLANDLDVCPKIVEYKKSNVPGDAIKILELDNIEWYEIIMEQCTLLDKFTDIDIDEYLTLYKRLLDNGIYYFDISMSNIVKDNNGRIRIIDYGHAHVGEFNTYYIYMWYSGKKEDLLDYASNILHHLN